MPPSAQDVLLGLVLFLVAFLPSLLYLLWVRNTERYGREPWSALMRAFAWGALGGVALALVLEVIADLWGWHPSWIERSLWGAVVVAPVAEEFAKALGLRFVRDRDPEPEDGLVYGAAAGLGFAATENLVYEVEAFLIAGTAAFVATVILRTLASTLVHAAASAVLGYAIWLKRGGGGSGVGIVLAYLVAVALHGGFNYLASLDSVLFGIVPAVALGVLLFGRLRRRIRELDRRGASALL